MLDARYKELLTAVTSCNNDAIIEVLRCIADIFPVDNEINVGMELLNEIVTIINTNNNDLVLDIAFGALENISDDAYNSVQFGQMSGGMVAIFNIIKTSNTDSVLESACRVLCNVASNRSDKKKY